jgi:hypothetical protein
LRAEAIWPHPAPQDKGVTDQVTRTPLTTRGRKQEGTLARSRNLHAAVTSDVIAALDKWIACQPAPKPNRADVVRLALDEWVSRQVLPLTHEDRDKLDTHIDRLEGEVAHLKPAASGKPSPATGMAMLRRGRAKNELAKAKNKRTNPGTS